MEQHVYIVISQTGTLLSRIIKLVTKAEYNHASISLAPDLDVMYSFGRKHPYNPFWGGFVKESPRWGTFKRFSQTRIMVLELAVTEEQIASLKQQQETLQQQQHWRSSLDQAQNSQQHAQAQLQSAQTQQLAHADDLQRLAEHAPAAGLQADYKALQAAQHSVQHSQQSLTAAQEKVRESSRSCSWPKSKSSSY